jgi:hypothetical protein
MSNQSQMTEHVPYILIKAWAIIIILYRQARWRWGASLGLKNVDHKGLNYLLTSFVDVSLFVVEISVVVGEVLTQWRKSGIAI